MRAAFLSNRWRVLVVGILLVVVLAGCSTQSDTPVVMVYKSPTCGCCEGWIEHMRANGFQVGVQNVDNVATIKKRFGVPADLMSCHTAIVDGYVVEGHVPAKEVQRLLSERPAILGIAVPGMPAGAPGMESPNTAPQPFEVVAFDKNGNTEVFARY